VLPALSLGPAGGAPPPPPLCCLGAVPYLDLFPPNHPNFFCRWPILKEWFTILTTTKDRNGTEYISTIEAKKYPFFGECLGRLGVLRAAHAALASSAGGTTASCGAAAVQLWAVVCIGA
jgi:hypothetical protein